jgi:hypothetical protein
MLIQSLPRRPERFASGTDLAVGTYHVQQHGDAFTICRTVGLHRWYPLTREDNPAWRMWPTRGAAQAQLDQHAGELCDYPFWGR